MDATISFLSNDLAALLAARTRLREMAGPEEWPAERAWPMNGDVVDALLRCFGQSYLFA